MTLKIPTHCRTLPHSLLYGLEDSHPLQNSSPLPPLLYDLEDSHPLQNPSPLPPLWPWRFPPIAELFPTPSSMALKISTHCRTLPHSLLCDLEGSHPLPNPSPLPPLWPWRFPFIAEPFPTPSSMALKGPIHFPHSLLYGLEDFDLSRKFCKYCLSLLCIMQSHLVVWRGNVTSTKYESVPGTDCQTFPILNQKHIKLSKMPYQQSVTQVFQGLIWKSLCGCFFCCLSTFMHKII